MIEPNMMHILSHHINSEEESKTQQQYLDMMFSPYNHLL
jgi:hypothetical protein